MSRYLTHCLKQTLRKPARRHTCLVEILMRSNILGIIDGEICVYGSAFKRTGKKIVTSNFVFDFWDGKLRLRPGDIIFGTGTVLQITTKNPGNYAHLLGIQHRPQKKSLQIRPKKHKYRHNSISIHFQSITNLCAHTMALTANHRPNSPRSKFKCPKTKR